MHTVKMTLALQASRSIDAVVLTTGAGPSELVIILVVALLALLIPATVLCLVFALGRRRGAADAAKSHRPGE